MPVISAMHPPSSIGQPTSKPTFGPSDNISSGKHRQDGDAVILTTDQLEWQSGTRMLRAAKSMIWDIIHTTSIYDISYRVLGVGCGLISQSQRNEQPRDLFPA